MDSYSGKDAQLIINIDAWAHKWELNSIRKMNAKSSALYRFKQLMFRMIRGDYHGY